MKPHGYLYIIKCANLANASCMHFLLKKVIFTVPCVKWMKIPAPSFFQHLSYGVKQVWRWALLLRYWRVQMRAKYQAEISSSEEATFSQTPPRDRNHSVCYRLLTQRRSTSKNKPGLSYSWVQFRGEIAGIWEEIIGLYAAVRQTINDALSALNTIKHLKVSLEAGDISSSCNITQHASVCKSRSCTTVISKQASNYNSNNTGAFVCSWYSSSNNTTERSLGKGYMPLSIPEVKNQEQVFINVLFSECWQITYQNTLSNFIELILRGIPTEPTAHNNLPNSLVRFPNEWLYFEPLFFKLGPSSDNIRLVVEYECCFIKLN